MDVSAAKRIWCFLWSTQHFDVGVFFSLGSVVRTTVDRRTPAPPGMYKTLKEWDIYQINWCRIFFHQPYWSTWTPGFCWAQSPFCEDHQPNQPNQPNQAAKFEPRGSGETGWPVMISPAFFLCFGVMLLEWKWSVFLSDPLNFSEFEVRHLKFPKQSITRIVKHITLQWKFTYPPKMAYLSRWFSELPVWWDMLIPKVGYVNSQGGIC